MSSARALLCATASLGLSAPLLAQHLGEPIDRSRYPVIDTFDRFVPLEDPDSPAAPPGSEGGGFAPRSIPGGPFYSSGLDPFAPISYFATEAGHPGLVDDYTGIRPGETGLHLTSFAFIGGALSPSLGGRGGRRIFFDFFDDDANLLSGFIWDAPSYQQGGWYISIDPNDSVLIDNLGFLQVSGAPGVPGVSGPTTLRWWYTGAVQIGDNQGALPADSTYPNTIYAFQLGNGPQIPAPGALGVLALGASLAGLRRKRQSSPV